MQDIQYKKLIFAGGTHQGLCREANEDSFCYVNYGDEINQMAVVADGIGGHRDGHLASMYCCRFMIQAWRDSGIGNEKNPEAVRTFLMQTLEQCNLELYLQNQQKPPGKPMGTTVVAVVFTPEDVVVGHAGDSRLYMCRGGRMTCWTEDHSLVMELVKKKIISEDEMKTHPYSHVILSSIGPSSSVKIEINAYERCPEHRYLLCSDGLTRHLTDGQVAEILTASSTPKVAMERLIRDTLRAGAEDNIAVVCVF